MTKNTSRIYLDYAAATPAADEVVGEMEPYFQEKFGNTGSLHAFGQDAMRALGRSRGALAGALGAKPSEVIFTGSATEANNAVLRGAIWRTGIKTPRIVISAIEHESVSETAEALASHGAEVVVIPVSREGVVDTAKLSEAIDENTILVSVIYASNVIGAVQPISEIAEIIRSFREKAHAPYPLFHTDAVQAVQFLPLEFDEGGIDAFTLSAQKMYGPKGVGALVLREGARKHIAPLITGGTQEMGFRAGTVNVPAIVGFAKAVELFGNGKNSKRIEKLRDMLWETLKRELPDIELNGPEKNRLPNNLNIYFPGRDNQELLVALDQKGVAVSTGSACSVRAMKPAPAVLALGFGEGRARGSIRITLGAPTTEEEIQEAAKRIIEVATR